jgi:hypothetical protein
LLAWSRPSPHCLRWSVLPPSRQNGTRPVRSSGYARPATGQWVRAGGGEITGRRRVADDTSTDGVERIAALVVERAAAVSPGDADLARRVVERLRPPRWTLEWHLPRWLGRAYGVAPALVDDFVLANVLGLVALRLEDDLVDGEVDADDVPGATRMSTALFAAAIGIYRGRFDPDSPIWPAIRRAMRRWRAGTSAGAPGGVAGAVGGAWERRRLARRGEPLKICGAAMCLLGGRDGDRHALEAAIEHALAAWVLADDAADWEGDLLAGRANAFVGALLATAPATPSADLRSEVLVAMLTSDALKRYYQRIDRESQRAASIAARLELTEFVEHVRSFGSRNRARGIEIQAEYHAVTDRAISVFLGSN